MSPVAGYGIGRCDAHRTLYGHWELHKECLDVRRVPTYISQATS